MAFTCKLQPFLCFILYYIETVLINSVELEYGNYCGGQVILMEKILLLTLMRVAIMTYWSCFIYKKSTCRRTIGTVTVMSKHCCIAGVARWTRVAAQCQGIIASSCTATVRQTCKKAKMVKVWAYCIFFLTLLMISCLPIVFSLSSNLQFSLWRWVSVA